MHRHTHRAWSHTRVHTQLHMHIYCHSVSMQSYPRVCAITHIVTYTKQVYTGSISIRLLREAPQVSPLTSAGYHSLLLIPSQPGELVLSPTEPGTGHHAESRTSPRCAVTSSLWYGPASTFQQHIQNANIHLWGPVLTL